MLESNEWSLTLPELPCCGERLRDLGIPFVHEAELEYGVKGMFIGGDMGLISCTKALSII